MKRVKCVNSCFSLLVGQTGVMNDEGLVQLDGIKPDRKPEDNLFSFGWHKFIGTDWEEIEGE